MSRGRGSGPCVAGNPTRITYPERQRALQVQSSSEWNAAASSTIGEKWKWSVGKDDQIAFCREVAQREDFAVVMTFEDRAVSGSSSVNRPGFIAVHR